MLEGVSNNITVNKQTPFRSTNTAVNNATQIVTDTLERQPKRDNLELTNKKPMSEKKKALLTIGGIITTTLAATYGFKKLQVKNIKNIQKAFQESFMRDNITIDETREILKRYKEIEKIKDDKEYAKALFKEAKKNFGLEKSNIELVFKEHKNANGYCNRTNNEISITPNCSRSHMLDTIHHEFRHAKQHNAIYNLYPEEYVGVRALVESYAEKIIDLNKDIKPEDLNIEELWSKALKEFQEKGIDLTDKQMQERINHHRELLKKNFVEESIPDKYKEWAKKCKDGARNYVSHDKNLVEYWNNFTEKDARFAGRKMSKYVKSKAFTPSDWAFDAYMKIRTFFAHKGNS